MSYTDEQKAAYKAGKAAAGKAGAATKKPARKGGAARAKGRVVKRKTIGKKRSGCTYKAEYTLRSTGEVVQRPCITGWRLSKQHGYQKLAAFLGKNDGIPEKESSRERFRVFVCTITSEAGVTVINGIYDLEYRKLKIPQMGLVANPFAANKGYFGAGGARLKGKATSGKK